MGLVPRSYCEFTDSMQLGVASYILSIAISQYIKMGVAHKNTYPAARLDLDYMQLIH